MSGYLLDTNAFIWLSEGKPSTVGVIDGLEGESFCLSIVSVWEMAIKIGIGRLTLDVPIAEAVNRAIENGVNLRALQLDDALAFSALEYPSNGHRDPFDRMLVVQARNSGFAVITSDRALSA